MHNDWKWTHIACTAGALVWIAFELYTQLSLEDALITFRYAENLASGLGYSFQNSEAVQGTTTPLFTLTLALAGTVFGVESIWGFADLLNLGLGIGSAYFTSAIMLKYGIGGKGAGIVALATMLLPSQLWAGAGGMESISVVFLMSFSLWATLNKRILLAAVLCTLLILSRLDTLIWVVLVFIQCLRMDWKRSCIGLVIGMLILLPWLYWSTQYFGSAIPHSILAKKAIVPDKYHYSILSPSAFIQWLKWAMFAWSSVFANVYFGFILFVAGGYLILRDGPTLWIPVVYSLVFPLTFYLAHGPRFPWYLVPVNWSSLLVGVVGFLWLKRWLNERPSLQSRNTFIPMLSLFVLVYLARDAEKFHEYKILQQNEVGLRMEVGKWLQKNTPQNATVAMEAIGYQGYYSDRLVIDMAGLISPEVVALTEENKRPYEMFYSILHNIKPNYLVLRSYEVENNKHLHGGPLFEDESAAEEFAALYEREIELQAPNLKAWGKNAKISIYKRR
jgi:hypothetical protein